MKSVDIANILTLVAVAQQENLTFPTLNLLDYREDLATVEGIGVGAVSA